LHRKIPEFVDVSKNSSSVSLHRARIGTLVPPVIAYSLILTRIDRIRIGREAQL